MVSPVSNGLPQQIPAANTFQPGGSTENVRQKESSDESRVVSSSQTSETKSASKTESSSVQASAREEDNGQTRSRSDRGSLVDVTV